MKRFFAGLALGWMTTASMLAQSTLETFYKDPDYQFTGVAVSQARRVFLNYPRWTPGRHKYDVVEILPDGGAKPFPNGKWNSWKPGDDAKTKWVCVQSVVVDDQDFLWVVDPASPEFAGVVGAGNKLVKIDLRNDSVVRTYDLSNVAGPKSYLNDVRVDTQRGVAYLTNSNEGGIIVVDLKSGAARQVLQGSASVLSDPAYSFAIAGVPLMAGGKPVKIQSDGIALSPDREWLFYKPLTDAKLYRIATADLRNAKLTAAELSARVQTVGSFCTTDGMIFDKAGNLYLGDIEKSEIIRLGQDLKPVVIAQDARLIWPDSYAISEGWLYVTCTQINKMPRFNEGKDQRTTPYALYRLKLPRP